MHWYIPYCKSHDLVHSLIRPRIRLFSSKHLCQYPVHNPRYGLLNYSIHQVPQLMKVYYNIKTPPAPCSRSDQQAQPCIASPAHTPALDSMWPCSRPSDAARSCARPARCRSPRCQASRRSGCWAGRWPPPRPDTPHPCSPAGYRPPRASQGNIDSRFSFFFIKRNEKGHQFKEFLNK